MGLMDILNGMQNGPRGNRPPATGKTGGGATAILFSGKLTVNGTSYVKRVLVPAVDPTQRSS